jgi:outer membrane protein OmpA-like peptidoglycan-associated protein
LSGDVSSVAHESILRQRALALFPQKTKSFDFREQPALPPGWALISELTLRAVAATHASKTEISATHIHMRGVTSNASLWQQGLSRLEMHLITDMRLDNEVSEINLTNTLERQCSVLFRTAMRGRKIEFPHSGSMLVSSVAPLLDELTQIAADCPTARIRIAGHTDTTGNESANVILSLARADAVAAYMTANGIAASRFTIAGAGSSQPLLNEETARARQLNRRIDIEMIFPDG